MLGEIASVPVTIPKPIPDRLLTNLLSEIVKDDTLPFTLIAFFSLFLKVEFLMLTPDVL